MKPIWSLCGVLVLISADVNSVPQEGACVDGFQLVKARYFGDGDVGGYFYHEDSCRELCANNYGRKNCLGFAFEPDSRGKCTLLQRMVLIRTSYQGNATRLLVKC